MAVIRNPDGTLSLDMGAGRVVPLGGQWESSLADSGIALPPKGPGLTDASRGATADLSFQTPGGSSYRITTPQKPGEAKDFGLGQYKAPGIVEATPALAKAAISDEQNQAELAAVERDNRARREAKDEGRSPSLKNGARMVSIPDAPATGPRMGGGGGGRLVPGQDVRAAYQISRTNIDPARLQEAEDAEADASIDAKLAAQSLSDTRTTRANELADKMQPALDAEEQAIARQHQINQARAGEFARRQDEIQRDRDSAESLQRSPQEVMGSAPLAAKLFAGLAMIAGGALQGLNKMQSNPGLDAVNQVINSRVQAARERYEARMRGVALKESEFDRLVKTYGSPDAAEAELRDRIQGWTQKFAAQQALYGQGQDAEAQTRALFADWDRDRAQSRLQREQQLAGSISEHFQYQPPHVVGGPPKVNERDVQALAKAREEAKLGEAEGEAGNIHDLISQVPEGDIPTPESRNVLSRGARAATNFLAGEGTASRTFDTPSEQAAAGKLGRAKSALLHKLSGAAVSPSEMERLQVGLNELNTREGLLRYNAELDRLNARREAGVRAGFKPEVNELYEERKRGMSPRAAPSGARGD